MISLVIPCLNECEVLQLTYEAVAAETEVWPEPVEIIFVDDGSTDGTWAIVEALAEQDWRVRGVRLTRNFGHQAALGAGLQEAQGDAMVVLDADLQDPPTLIRELIDRWHRGAEIVYAQRVRRRQETLFKRIAGCLFYRLLDRVTDVPIPRDTGDFCLMDRRVVQTLLGFREQAMFWRGLRAWTGYRQEAVHFERPGRARGKSKYTLRKLMELGGNGLLTFSSLPLRLPLYAGAVGCGVSILLIFVSLFAYLFRSEPLLSALALGLVFFSSVQLLSLGVIGEYLQRIYVEVRGRPRWVVDRQVGRTIERRDCSRSMAVHSETPSCVR
jgi:dolichol-phosphate mannosyltransferase